MGITYNWVDKGCQESSLSGGTLELQFGDVTVDMPVIYTNGAAEKAVGYESEVFEKDRITTCFQCHLLTVASCLLISVTWLSKL